MFARRFVYERDGGPVWYVRPQQFEQSHADLRSWMVRFGRPDGGFLDWTHKREWRVPGEALGFAADDVLAVLVGNPDWAPSLAGHTVVDGYANGVTGEPCDQGEMYAVEYTSTHEDWPMTWLKARRWYWDGATIIDLESSSPV